MKVRVKTFGIASEICKERHLEIEVPNECSVVQLKQRLSELYPELSGLLHYRIAVNHTYEVDSFILRMNDEVAIIPPVSGG